MALLLGRTLNEIEEQFWRISSLVFRKGWFTTAQQLTYTGSKYDARVLEDLFRDQVEILKKSALFMKLSMWIDENNDLWEFMPVWVRAAAGFAE